MREQVKSYISTLQGQIIAALESLDTSLDGARFMNDRWERVEGGYGQSSVLSGGTHIEKAGVNISVVHGKLPPAAVKQMRADHEGLPWTEGGTASLPFFAAGLSLVIHPCRPEAPTVHANYRYFEITEEAGPENASSDAPPKILAWWFGGGSDLTPSYLFPADAQHFHRTLKAACDPFGDALYPSFKKWCDEYFYIPHRKESRGIGGIFFDDLSKHDHKRLTTGGRPRQQDEIWAFVRSCGDAFVPSYLPIIQRRISTTDGVEKPLAESEERKRRWQLIRRGRYVEFNLVYDRGTKFGLMTPGARIESILMSLPETARWEYCSELGEEEGSREKELLDVLKNPKEWA
ncbi:coproporphyrinogen III oxidase [Hysterangium stoloniferum]|nr:coproporphyrinogen III oxidase [Hysterangium stoloniferum]